MSDSKAPAYSLMARALHWITAVLVLSTIPIGVLMVNVSAGPLQDLLDTLHRSIGVVIIPLVIIRLGYRLTHPPFAHTTHRGLYALLIVQSFLGWVATSAYGAPVRVFGLFELPPIWPRDQPFSERLFVVHQLVGLAIACLAAAHIGAALYHHFVRSDGVLMRMINC